MKTRSCISNVSGLTLWTSLLGFIFLVCSNCDATGSESLRYKFEQGKDYVYEVKIVATLPDAVETRHGTTMFHHQNRFRPGIYPPPFRQSDHQPEIHLAASAVSAATLRRVFPG